MFISFTVYSILGHLQICPEVVTTSAFFLNMQLIYSSNVCFCYFHIFKTRPEISAKPNLFCILCTDLEEDVCRVTVNM